MLKASKSGLFEVYMEVLVEGDCVTRSRVHYHLVAKCDSLAEANEAADIAASRCEYAAFEFRYPEAFARVHNTFRQRQVVKSVSLDDAPF